MTESQKLNFYSNCNQSSSRLTTTSSLHYGQKYYMAVDEVSHFYKVGTKTCEAIVKGLAEAPHLPQTHLILQPPNEVEVSLQLLMGLHYSQAILQSLSSKFT